MIFKAKHVYIVRVVMFFVATLLATVSYAQTDSDVLESIFLDASATDAEILEQFVLYAEDTIDFHDRATVYFNPPYADDESAMWGNYVNIGVDALTKTVVAGDGGSQGEGVWLRDRGEINGHAAVKSFIRTQNQIEISGNELTGKNIEMPTLDFFTPESVGFPASIEGDATIVVDSGVSLPLSPNQYYGEIAVNSGGELILGCGSYYLDGLYLNSAATLSVSNSANDCDTEIYLKQYLVSKGSIEVFLSDEAPDPARLMWGIFGESVNNFLETNFFGTIFAPSSNVVLNCGKSLRGAVYAENIEIGQDAYVTPKKAFGLMPTVPPSDQAVSPGALDAQIDTDINTVSEPFCKFKEIRMRFYYELSGTNSVSIYTSIPFDYFDSGYWGEACDPYDDELLTVADDCSIMDISQVPGENISSYWVELVPYHEHDTFVFESWYWWKHNIEWKGPANPVFRENDTDEPGPDWVDGYTWAYKNKNEENLYWNTGLQPYGCGPKDDSVENLETWIQPDYWPPDGTGGECGGPGQPSCWAEGNEAMTGAAYSRWQYGEDFELESNQRMLAFGYTCSCEWCGSEYYTGARIIRFSGDFVSCTPGATECVDSDHYHICHEVGAWSAPIPCSNSCYDGDCAECNPGEWQCVDDTYVRQCGVNHEWGPSTQCNFYCDIGGSDMCEGWCSPGDFECLPGMSSTQYRVCNASYSWDLDDCEYFCDDVSSQCGGECAPGETRCTGDTQETCGADYTFAGGSSQSCSGNGCDGDVCATAGSGSGVCANSQYFPLGVVGTIGVGDCAEYDQDKTYNSNLQIGNWSGNGFAVDIYDDSYSPIAENQRVNTGGWTAVGITWPSNGRVIVNVVQSDNGTDATFKLNDW